MRVNIYIYSLKPNYCTPSRRVFSFVVPLHSMPEDPSVNQTAGYISVNPITKYFFWLFEAKEHLVGSMVIPLAGSDYSFFLFSSFFLGKHWVQTVKHQKTPPRNPSSAPLVMWLSGGPGCSSQLALFAENGPCDLHPWFSGGVLGVVGLVGSENDMPIPQTHRVILESGMVWWVCKPILGYYLGWSQLAIDSLQPQVQVVQVHLQRYLELRQSGKKRLLGAAGGSRRCWLALHDEAVRKKSSLFGKFWQDWQAAHKSAMVRVSDVSGSQYKTWQVWCWLQLLTNTAWPVVIKWDQQCIRYKSLGDWGVIPVLPTHTGITRTYYDYNPSKSIMRNFRSTGHSIHWAQVNIPTEILLLGTTPQTPLGDEELFFFTAGWPGVPGNSDKDLWVWIHPPNRLVM